MVEAGVPEEIIVSKVKKNGAAFDLTPAQLIALKKANASNSLVQVLMDPTQPYTAGPKSRPCSGCQGRRAVRARYRKTGGTIKSLASAGVVKKDLNGNIDGPASRTSIKTPVEILIVAAEGVAVEEYQFLRLRVNKDYREFRSVTGGILNQRSGAMRDLIPFEGKKISSRNYVVLIPPNLGAGEYGFLPPGAGGTSTTAAVSAQYGKMFTFRIVE